MLLECNMAHVLTKVQRGHFLLDRKRKALQEPTRVKSPDPSKIQYDIGMIMKHIRYDYYCVIYGWDYSCEMTEAWIHQMGVDQLPLGPNQPFYNVLVNDGTNRYAAQESLTVCPVSELRPIRHWEVGKYFKSFAGNRYIPNNALEEKYPNTAAD
ncbi:PREDICTED: F-box only protein 21-like [Amphimedon queenslandica]|uniref:Hemimethylated DNA-binding domain-containing protein n=2 Tax=Amphimedon queenslandica TaxID=400682 RepID=A0AAN0JQM7_AMPQE|nr:PREDICTED: F-box only protein 21-like [Amphimedon queenslandica]|eukprot:XP_019859343.1 PREDICTED: F-box only protein 21-like [Amphimedon queenslandica]